MASESPPADVPVDHAMVCQSCDARWYYSRRRCPACHSTAFASYPLGTGELLAITTVHVTPSGVRSPNRLGLVRFDDGVSLIAQLTGSPAVGDRVAFEDLVVLRDGEDPVVGPQLTTTERD